ncbi:TetR/AcrR family transcriptional regulator [Candidatus Gracilibacteria bacterium]|nr:TetR/AcrR family transcriptional regulator [Candidatus Gracilibacteria bacterium]
MDGLQSSPRRAQINQVAEQLFSRKGYHATTMREIARALAIEGGSLYSHIASKQVLLFELVLACAEEFRRTAQAVIAEGGSARDQLRRFMRQHVAVIAASIDRAAVYFHEWRHLDTGQQAVIRQQRDEYDEFLRAILRSGIASGEFAAMDEKLVSLQILSQLNWSYQWYRPEGPLNSEDLAEAFFEIVMRGLEPR